MDFDPDAYLAKKQQAANSFDPDAYLASKGQGSQPAPEQVSPPEGTIHGGIAEAAKAIIGGAAATSLGGLQGVASLVTGQGLGAAVEDVGQGQQNAQSFAPQTQAGQKTLKTIGDLMAMGVDLANVPISGIAGLGELFSGQGIDAASNMVEGVQKEGLGPTMGEDQFQKTGSPAIATLAHMMPDALLGAGGKMLTTPKHTPRAKLFDSETGELTKGFSKQLQKKGVMSGTVTPEDVRRLSDVSPKKAVNELIIQKAKDGGRENYLAPYRVEKQKRLFGADKDKLVDDDLANEARKQDIDDADIMAIKSADGPTKGKMAKMLTMHRSIKGNSSLAQKYRHTDVIGDSALSRFNYLRSEANKARGELNRLVKSGPDGTNSRLIEGPNAGIRGKQVDLSRIENTFFGELDKLKVSYTRDQGAPSINFKGSIIEENAASKRLVAAVARLMNQGGRPDAVAAHHLKRQLDDLIDFKKQDKGGLTASGKRFAKSLRHEINQVIRDISPAYAKTNDKLSKILTALDEFDKSMGSSIDLFAPSANKAVGTNLRKILSNYSTRGEIEDALVKLSDTANHFGGKFDDNVQELVNFGKILDDRFGPVARGSFQAEVSAGTVDGMAKNAARGLKGGLKNGVVDAAIDYGAGKIQEARGINTDNAYKAMEKLIKR